MLALLLDENIAPRVADQVLGRRPHARILSIHGWQAGAFLQADDETILAAAQRECLTLVTFDLSTIPLVLKDWAEQGRPHGGVVLIDEKSIGQNDYGGLVRALVSLWDRMDQSDFTNAVLFLQPPRP